MACMTKLRKLCSGHDEIGPTTVDKVYINVTTITVELRDESDDDVVEKPPELPNFALFCEQFKLTDSLRGVFKDCISFYRSENDAIFPLLDQLVAKKRKNTAGSVKKISKDPPITVTAATTSKKRKLSQVQDDIVGKKRKVDKSATNDDDEDVFIQTECSRDDLFDKMKNIFGNVKTAFVSSVLPAEQRNSALDSSRAEPASETAVAPAVPVEYSPASPTAHAGNKHKRHHRDLSKKSSSSSKSSSKKIKSKIINNLTSPSFNVLASKKKLKRILHAKTSEKSKKHGRHVLSNDESSRFDDSQAEQLSDTDDHHRERARTRKIFHLGLAKAIVQSMNIRDSRAKGPVHPFCTATFSAVQLYRTRSQFVPIYVPEEAEDDWLRNLTAKITKTARQRDFLRFRSDQPQFNFDSDDAEPRFRFDKRPPHKTFLTKYATDGSKYAMFDNDVPDYHGVFSAKIYREKAKNLDDIFNSYSVSLGHLEHFFLCVQNMQALYMHCLHSPYGDVPSSRREMFERIVPVPRGISSSRGCTVLTEEIRRLYYERGRKPERYFSWNYRDPCPYPSPPPVNVGDLPSISGYTPNGSSDSPPSMLAEILATPLAPDFPWSRGVQPISNDYNINSPATAAYPNSTNWNAPLNSNLSGFSGNRMPLPSCQRDPRLESYVGPPAQQQQHGLPSIDNIYRAGRWCKPS